MNRLVFTLVLMLIALLANNSQVRPVTEIERAQAGEVMKTISSWASAVRDRDAKALHSLFDEQLIITTPDGKLRGKSEELAILKPNDQMEFVSVANDEIKIRVISNTAIATGRVSMGMRSGGKESQTAFRYTSVWIFQDGRWQLAALHTSRPS